ncbi:hypothetical protein F5884DRAFT_341602 [Xylogone sp. PMI_703]|nr:hypothetical protein F5884DRAFT_341602 [Xylogone sp. PMI_703]
MYHQTLVSETPSPHSSAQPETIYFAYGSNLAFGQMAARCPSSVFVGRGRLHNYRFQINERGYANVVPSEDPGSFVDGLCYRLSPSDERSLDRSEGVPTAYEKHLQEVEFWSAKRGLGGITVVDILDFSEQKAQQQLDKELNAHRSTVDRPEPKLDGMTVNTLADGQASSYQEVEQPTDTQVVEAEAKAESIMALVYISPRYIKDGTPWDEYIHRMEVGPANAIEQGISREYVDSYVRPLLKSGRGTRIFR